MFYFFNLLHIRWFCLHDASFMFTVLNSLRTNNDDINVDNNDADDNVYGAVIIAAANIWR